MTLHVTFTALALAALCGCSSARGSAGHPEAGHPEAGHPEAGHPDAGPPPVPQSDAAAPECAPFSCDAGCRGGIVTSCEVLDPPPGMLCGGVEVATGFCPFGCNQHNQDEHCNYYPAVDGGLCEASSVTITTGMLGPSDGGAPQAVCARLSTTVRITVATSLGAACLGEADAGTAAGGGSGAILTVFAPLNATGTFPATGAQLTVWKNGMLVVDREPATSGSVALTMQDYTTVYYGSGGSGTQGGSIGSYDITFGSDVEKGTFVAPLCDACTASL